MADELARRREIRRQKILEGSEARLKKITSSTNKKSAGIHYKDDPECLRLKTPVTDATISRTINISEENSLRDRSVKEDKLDSSKLYSEKDLDSISHSSNGNYSRSSDYYEFPKKVSDAETRSFGRTRSDIRRNSSCTQIMMETLQSSSFYSVLLRFWMTVVSAFGLKLYFLLFNPSVFETIFIPFLLLEIGFLSWTKYDYQTNSRPAVSSLLSGILLLYGFNSTTVTRLQSVLTAVQLATIDFCSFVFSFVFCHFIFEVYL